MEWIILLLIVAVAGYAIYIYNQLVQNRQLVEEGWSGVDVQLKRRADLIPNMLETTLQAVTEARVAVQAAQGASPAARGRRDWPAP